MEDDTPETSDGFVPMEDDGFIALVGPLYAGPMAGETGRFRFKAQDKHRNLRGVVQGGMLMTFADRAMGMTARQGDRRMRSATVQLDVHFVDAVRIGDLVEIECRVLRRTRSLIFMDGAMTIGGRLVATARGTWKLLRPLPEDGQEP